MPPCYILAASRLWYSGMVKRLQKAIGGEWLYAATKEELFTLNLVKLQPRYIFFPHWSWLIPKAIWSAHECVVFHMTDLPFGRGGSPLQNLIVRGITETKISALRVEADLDCGPIYMKRPLSLYGNAEEIYLRAGGIVAEMIEEICVSHPILHPQTGEAVIFKRRNLSQSDISGVATLPQIFDYIRMLDAEGYPPAFIEVGNLHLEFSRAALRQGKIEADVTITIKDEPT